MSNLFDYINWRGDLPFGVAPFTPADAGVLARLIYFPIEKMHLTLPATIGQIAAAAKAAPLQGQLLHPEDGALLAALGGNARFGGVQLTDFAYTLDPVEQTQFCAGCFALGGRRYAIAFRGTDDTLTGWEEDFAMAFECPVQSQRLAGEYINRISRPLGRYILCGHSKGGNLAVYAGYACQKPGKLQAIYCLDGPGFWPGVADSPGMQQIAPIVQRYTPTGGIVGQIMQGVGECTVVQSSGSGGVEQHDLYRWHTTPTGFTTAPGLTPTAVRFSEAVQKLLTDMDMQQRRQFVQAVFGVLRTGGATTVAQLGKLGPTTLLQMAVNARNLPDQTKELLQRTIAAFVGAVMDRGDK